MKNTLFLLMLWIFSSTALAKNIGENSISCMLVRPGILDSKISPIELDLVTSSDLQKTFRGSLTLPNAFIEAEVVVTSTDLTLTNLKTALAAMSLDIENKDGSNLRLASAAGLVTGHPLSTTLTYINDSELIRLTCTSK